MASLAICGTGKHGLAIAGVLGRWCEQMLPGVEVRRPSQIAFDSGWSEAIVRSVQGIDAALICAFRKDVRSSQLHFQLGACFRALGPERPLAPVLIDMEPKDIAHTPFELFQCVTCCERDLRKLLQDLSSALLPMVPATIVLERFSNSWNELQRAMDLVPGPEIRPFEITLALPGITRSWPYSAGPSDGEWRATAGPMIAALPQLGFPEFDASQLHYLDLSRQEWIRPPHWLSRIGTSHLGLIHPALLTEWSSNPKEVTKYVKLSLGGARPGPTLYASGNMSRPPGLPDLPDREDTP